MMIMNNQIISLIMGTCICLKVKIKTHFNQMAIHYLIKGLL